MPRYHAAVEQWFRIAAMWGRFRSEKAMAVEESRHIKAWPFSEFQWRIMVVVTYSRRSPPVQYRASSANITEAMPKQCLLYKSDGNNEIVWKRWRQHGYQEGCEVESVEGGGRKVRKVQRTDALCPPISATADETTDSTASAHKRSWHALSASEYLVALNVKGDSSFTVDKLPVDHSLS